MVNGNLFQFVFLLFVEIQGLCLRFFIPEVWQRRIDLQKIGCCLKDRDFLTIQAPKPCFVWFNPVVLVKTKNGKMRS